MTHTEPRRRQIAVPAGIVEVTEQGDGPPVVLLHGLLMDEHLWDAALPHLPPGFTYIRPVLPLGAHRIPMNDDADLALPAMTALVADLLEAMDLSDVTLAHTDWGGGLFLTAMGRDERVKAQVILPCEAFDNFPPGLPGKMVGIARRIPGGLTLAAHQIRNRFTRRNPLVFGQMIARPIPDALAHRWTEPVLTNPKIKRDLAKYVASEMIPDDLIRKTEALREFHGPTLVLWSPDNRVMPPAHGHRLAQLIPQARYAEIPGAAVLSMLDEPAAVAAEMGAFLQQQ